jgi:hypothetical protein
MPFVERDPAGDISALHDAPTARALEFLENDAPEIRHFLSKRLRADQALETLRASDGDFIRALEDLIDLLLRKKVISLDELPGPVRAKLDQRTSLRETFRASPLLKFDDDLV